MAHSQWTADASSTGGSEDGSAQARKKMDTAEVSAGGPAPPRRLRKKRSLPVPDLDAIKDPAEMKLQKRLLKNRRTAAVSRDRKQKEMERLLAKAKALQAVNEELSEALKQRTAQILALRMDILGRPPQAPAALRLSPQPAERLASAFRGNLPLHVPGSSGLPIARPWPEPGQPQSSGDAAWNATAHSLLLPDEHPATAAPLAGRPMSMPPRETLSMNVMLSPPSSSCSSAEVDPGWSRGLSAVPESGFFRDLNCQPLRLSPVSALQLSMEDLPMSCSVGELDGQPLRWRALSCPVPGVPAVETAGEICPSGELQQQRSGSYSWHMPAHVSGQSLHVVPGTSQLVPPGDPTGLDQMDFADFWHAIE